MGRYGKKWTKEELAAYTNRRAGTDREIAETNANAEPPAGKIILDVEPMGKPRMTQRDKWAKRGCVTRYWEFKDRVKEILKDRDLTDIGSVSWIAYFPMPKSWSKKKKESMTGEPHRNKPDRDNIDKALLDAIFPEDSGIWAGRLEKRWDDGNGPRIELFLEEKTFLEFHRLT